MTTSTGQDATTTTDAARLGAASIRMASGGMGRASGGRRW
jgi:hypothetical protein